MFPVAFGVVGFTIITAAAAWFECGINPKIMQIKQPS